jgi:hypothetical protein
MRPSGASAVMAERRSGMSDARLDYFPTPPWAARAGGELIRRLDPEASSVWEPACGGGHMVHGLRDYFNHWRASDVHAYGNHELLDFLDPGAVAGAPDADRWDWIVTNPPFVAGEAFVRAAWPLARRGVAMLLRLSFLEGAARHRLLYEDFPLTVCAPFAERVPMVAGRWDPAASSATAYAWFVWCKAGPWAKLAGSLQPIAPGAKARLTRPDDAIRFGVAAETPLFDEPEEEEP